jgi:hypothetical protein
MIRRRVAPGGGIWVIATGSVLACCGLAVLIERQVLFGSILLLLGVAMLLLGLGVSQVLPELVWRRWAANGQMRRYSVDDSGVSSLPTRPDGEARSWSWAELPVVTVLKSYYILGEGKDLKVAIPARAFATEEERAFRSILSRYARSPIETS